MGLMDNEEYFARLEKSIKSRLFDEYELDASQARFVINLVSGAFATRGAALYYISDKLGM